MTGRVSHIMYVTPCLDSILVIFVHLLCRHIKTWYFMYCGFGVVGVPPRTPAYPASGDHNQEWPGILRRERCYVDQTHSVYIVQLCILQYYNACCVNDISKSGMMSSCDTSIEKWCCSLNSCTPQCCGLSISNVNACISCPSSGAIITDLDSTILSWPPHQILTFAPWSRKIPCAINANPFLFVS